MGLASSFLLSESLLKEGFNEKIIMKYAGFCLLSLAYTISLKEKSSQVKINVKETIMQSLIIVISYCFSILFFYNSIKYFII
jgi:hypothetical protein